MSKVKKKILSSHCWSMVLKKKKKKKKKKKSQFRGIKRDIPKIEIIKTITMYLGYS